MMQTQTAKRTIRLSSADAWFKQLQDIVYEKHKNLYFENFILTADTADERINPIKTDDEV